ncbi:MAG: glycosyltransferase family 39 protein [Actinomycetota bacterium]|nr:glycosyltransferase family 39 protein [Actinomycetota bacterium]
MLEDAAPYSLGAAPTSGAARTGTVLMRIFRTTPWAVCAITAAAAALRFTALGGVDANDFYDAAVRSMSLSFHNFFFGAFDPGAALSLDKPPLDLWLQVASVKLFGWSSLALKLPEALCGTLSVPLLYDAVRRAAGRPAGLAAATVLALLPESVLTARSDTMDSVMMLLVIGALWLTICACVSHRRRPLILAGVALGLAFEVKLLEALVAAPALVVLYGLAAKLPVRNRVRNLLLAGGALLVAGLSWAVAVSLAPGHHPWAVGSSDGSVWNAMFVFNGVGKVSGASNAKPGGPGPFRLLVSTGWHYDVLFGCVLAAAIAIGLAAAVVFVWRGRQARANGAPILADANGEAPARANDAVLARGFAISLVVWIAFAILLFDTMGTVHARYLEALAPALAATIGYGAVTLAGLPDGRGRPGTTSMLALTVALLGISAYTFGLQPASVGWSATALIVAAVGAGLLARAGGRIRAPAKWLTAAMILACALVFPAHESLLLVRTGANDSLGLATAPAGDAAALSRYLEPRTAGVHYELAIDEPLALAPLIIRDRRPILALTSFGGRPLAGIGQLVAAVRTGAVRYGLAGNYNCGPRSANRAACGPAALWIRHNGIDVSSPAGLTGGSKLYLLLPSRAG